MNSNVVLAAQTRVNLAARSNLREESHGYDDSIGVWPDREFEGAPDVIERHKFLNQRFDIDEALRQQVDGRSKT